MTHHVIWIYSDILATEPPSLSTMHAQNGAEASSGAPSTGTYANRSCHYLGGKCFGLTEEDTSRGVPGVRQHLWHYHRNHFIYNSQGKYVCRWHTGPEPCYMPISDLDNLARHIASVHLQLTAQRCLKCKSQFSRMDALLRHCKKCT